MSKSATTPDQLHVGFDLDGVVYDFRQAMSDYLISIGRTECSIESALPEWDFFKGWGMTLSEYLALYRDGVDAGYVLRVGEPMPGAVQAMCQLSEAGHAIHIVTDRSVGSEPGISECHTKAWLADHRFRYDTLTISSDKTVVPTDFFIDDRYENYVARRQAGLSCHLLTRPWNVALGDDSTERIDSIDDFVRAILQAEHTALLAV